MIHHTNYHDASVTTKNEKVRRVGTGSIMNPLKSQTRFKMIYGSLLQVSQLGSMSSRIH
ncbi:MAG: hypothetical protein HQ517_03485 [SAR324 cluster bacterium]|nr:hypothetical protein [SAR324 cluster bacterium]